MDYCFYSLLWGKCFPEDFSAKGRIEVLAFLLKYRKYVLKVVIILVLLYFTYRIAGGIWAIVVAFLSSLGFLGTKKKESVLIEKRVTDDYKEFLKRKRDEHQANKEEAERLEKEMNEFLEELRGWQ